MATSYLHCATCSPGRCDALSLRARRGPAPLGGGWLRWVRRR
ncbi:hypothetical protein PJI17_08745 [Mycobacterium kansasii]